VSHPGAAVEAAHVVSDRVQKMLFTPHIGMIAGLTLGGSLA
jgi:hypothetical protein